MSLEAELRALVEAWRATRNQIARLSTQGVYTKDYCLGLDCQMELCIAPLTSILDGHEAVKYPSAQILWDALTLRTRFEGTPMPPGLADARAAIDKATKAEAAR